MKIYDFILQGHEATEENATDAARGLDWQEIEAREENIKLSDAYFIDKINGLEIYYNFGADYYFFAEAEEINELSFSSRRSAKKYTLIARENNDGLFNVYCQAFGALSGAYLGEALINSNIFGAPDLGHVAEALNLNNLTFEIY